MKIEITNQEKWHQSLTLKLGLLAIISLFLMIPLEIIKEIIKERQSNAEKVRKEISDQWASKQTVSGPVLNIPLRTIPLSAEETPRTVIWHIMPEELSIKGKFDPEIRYRSIYKTVVYKSQLKFKGSFVIPEGPASKDYVILWNEAYFTTGVSDNRGVNGDIRFDIGGSVLSAEPGLKDNDLFASGISFPCPIDRARGEISFSLDMNLSGSEGFLITPLGKMTGATLNSVWDSPGFTGSFLPVKRTIDKNGFTAEWQVTHLNRNFPQQWTGSVYHPQESAFGFDLFMPVDHYQKSVRSAKYGILFIALTFLVLIFLETTRKEYIHVFNYFLVSLALILFFSLLNSLSEQLGFGPAYLISAASIILLISFFTGTIMKNSRIGLTVFGMLSLLYGFIYVLLTLNDYSYLAGNIGLFVLLAVIMRQAARMKLLSRDSSA